MVQVRSNALESFGGRENGRRDVQLPALRGIVRRARATASPDRIRGSDWEELFAQSLPAPSEKLLPLRVFRGLTWLDHGADEHAKRIALISRRPGLISSIAPVPENRGHHRKCWLSVWW